MNNKEYRAKLDEIETYHSFDTLTPEELKELRADMKTRRGFALKGFNDRAIVKYANGIYTLTSYYTDVCSYCAESCEFKKLWDGFSTTTLKHINAFCEYFHIPGYNKRKWIAL